MFINIIISLFFRFLCYRISARINTVSITRSTRCTFIEIATNDYSLNGKRFYPLNIYAVRTFLCLRDIFRLHFLQL